MLLTDVLSAAELYRQLAAALCCDKAMLHPARSRACTAGLQLVASTWLTLVEQGRHTSNQAAEVLAAAHQAG
jgi:hypothetical protein